MTRYHSMRPVILASCTLLASAGHMALAQEQAQPQQNRTALAFSAAYSEQYKATVGADLISRSSKDGGINFTLSALRHQRGHSVTLKFDHGTSQMDALGGGGLFYGLTVDDQNWQGQAYSTRNLGGFAGIRWDLAKRGALSVRYALGRSRISDVAASTSSLVAAEAGELVQSSLRLSYQLASGPLAGSSAWDASFKTSAELFGLGGDTKSANLSANAKLSREITSGFTLSGRASAGTATGLDGYAPRITERAFLSTSLPRGFGFTGIGPADVSGGTRTGLGGLHYTAVSLEAEQVLANLQKSAISGYVFADAGSVWGLDKTAVPGGVIDDGMAIRSSVGLGLGWSNPIGQLSVSYAKTIGTTPTDVVQPWQFMFRTDF
jgi:outer membrane protein insertion porin family